MVPLSFRSTDRNKQNVMKNIEVYYWSYESTVTYHYIADVKILLLLLFSLNSAVLYCYHRVNTFSNGTHVRSRVNLVHFKGAQLDSYETYIMKLTC